MFKNNWQLISVIRVRCNCATGRDSIGCKNVDGKQMEFSKYGQMQSAILSMEIVTKSNVTFIEFRIYGFYSKGEDVYRMMGPRVDAA